MNTWGDRDEHIAGAVRDMSREELRARIADRKTQYGRELVILGHHYQRQDVIDFSDYRGDSLALSRLAS